MATVIVTSLQCDETYDITAGGIFSTELMGQTLDGPRFHTEIVPTASCTIIPTTTLPSKEVLLCHYTFVCVGMVMQDPDIVCIHLKCVAVKRPLSVAS